LLPNGFSLLAELSVQAPPCIGKGERAMRQTKSSLQSSPPIHTPACPKCGLPMWIIRIEPDDPDHDLRTYECPECKRAEVLLVDIGRGKH
jgi:hypothetical protein